MEILFLNDNTEFARAYNTCLKNDDGEFVSHIERISITWGAEDSKILPTIHILANPKGNGKELLPGYQGENENGQLVFQFQDKKLKIGHCYSNGYLCDEPLDHITPLDYTTKSKIKCGYPGANWRYRDSIKEEGK